MISFAFTCIQVAQQSFERKREEKKNRLAESQIVLPLSSTISSVTTDDVARFN